MPPGFAHVVFLYSITQASIRVTSGTHLKFSSKAPYCLYILRDCERHLLTDLAEYPGTVHSYMRSPDRSHLSPATGSEEWNRACGISSQLWRIKLLEHSVPLPPTSQPVAMAGQNKFPASYVFEVDLKEDEEMPQTCLLGLNSSLAHVVAKALPSVTRLQTQRPSRCSGLTFSAASKRSATRR